MAGTARLKRLRKKSLGGERRPSGAKARTYSQRLSGTLRLRSGQASKLVPFPILLTWFLFPRPVKACPFKAHHCNLLFETGHQSIAAICGDQTITPRLQRVTRQFLSANVTSNDIPRQLNGTGPNALQTFAAATLKRIDSASQSSGRDALPAMSHFAWLMEVKGKIYVGTNTTLEVFGLLSVGKANVGCARLHSALCPYSAR